MYSPEVTTWVQEMMLSERTAMMIATRHKNRDEMIARRTIFAILFEINRKRMR